MASDNLITPNGIKRIQDEMEWLRSRERPRVVAEVSYAASMGDRSENAEYIYGKKRLREIDSRLNYLVTNLDRIVIVDPAKIPGARVGFGATVVVSGEDGVEKTWRLYGEQEVDVGKGVLSHQSPLARALYGREAGDSVRYETPGGVRELEIIDVRYEPQIPDPEAAWRTAPDKDVPEHLKP